MSKLFRGLFQIRREEMPLTALMFTYFFLVITVFWILKPLKKGLFIGFYKNAGGLLLGNTLLTATQAEQLAKMANVVVAFAAVIVFTLLARHYRREKISYAFVTFFLGAFLFLGSIIDHVGTNTVWIMYLLGDLFPTLMVVTFFAFLNDSVTPGLSKRLYGIIGLGGVIGGVFGSTFVRVWITELTYSEWIWICFGLTVAIGVIAGTAGHLVRKSHPPEPEAALETETRLAAIEGALIVRHSKYLLSIAAMVGLYEIISCIIDFQFTATVAHYVATPEIKNHFSTVYTITNWVSFGIQLLLTSVVMTRLGVGIALLFLPIAVVSVSLGFLMMPILFLGSALNTADNAFNYSINQSSREALYVPTRRSEKYKAKAFIDMFVQRFAKALGVIISLAITTAFSGFENIRWLSIPVILLMALWIWIAIDTAKMYQKRVGKIELLHPERRAA